jgi:uncharacterized membrane protein YphA (DoxX/SURF4 family)
MNIELAIRLTEIFMAFAFLQQSVEHLYHSRRDIFIFLPRIILCLCLMIGFQTQLSLFGLFIIALMMLHRFQGPYNGGSDRMGILILFSLCLLHFIPNDQWQEYVFAYLAAQVTLSYFIAGWVKIINPDWRSGQALQDVFAFSTYPVSESLRGWVKHPQLLKTASWGVILFELIFPLAFFSQITLVIVLVIATIFHCANACLFGLNRFFWIWLAAYPSLIWLQDRIIGL